MIKYLKIRKSAMDYMRSDVLLDSLAHFRIIQLIENNNYVVIGRYSTNKAKLRKALCD